MRLIDADAIPYTMLYKENWLKGTGIEKQGAWKDDIDALPTVDAVPVIRCKDCKYRDEFDTCNGLADGIYVHDDDYCSYAERKEG